MTILTTLVVLLTMMEPSEPVSFVFERGCGPEGNREQSYDSRTGQYLVHVHEVARFRVRSVARDLEQAPVVLRISGMLDHPEGPLTLRVDGKLYSLYHEKFDKELFRVERHDGVTTVEFLPKAKTLLKPGATFEYIDYYRG